MTDQAPPSKAFVVAVIATFRRKDLVERVLQSLEATKAELRAIIVVDNAADAETRDVVERFRRAKWVGVAENAGCGGGLRLGAQEALEEFGTALTHLWFLDDDVTLPAEALPRMLQELNVAGADLGCPMTVNIDGRIDFAPGLLVRKNHRAIRKAHAPSDYLAGFSDASVPLSWTTGVCLLVSRRAIDHLGLHRTDYWIRGEDLEFSLRVTRCYKGIFIPAVIVPHLPPATPPTPDSRASEFRRHCALLQNTTYTAIHLPHGRPMLLLIPGTYRRFFRVWGCSPATVWTSLRLFWEGMVRGYPAGASPRFQQISLHRE